MRTYEDLAQDASRMAAKQNETLQELIKGMLNDLVIMSQLLAAGVKPKQDFVDGFEFRLNNSDYQMFVGSFGMSEETRKNLANHGITSPSLEDRPKVFAQYVMVRATYQHFLNVLLENYPSVFHSISSSAKANMINERKSWGELLTILRQGAEIFECKYISETLVPALCRLSYSSPKSRRDTMQTYIDLRPSDLEYHRAMFEGVIKIVRAKPDQSHELALDAAVMLNALRKRFPETFSEICEGKENDLSEILEFIAQAPTDENLAMMIQIVLSKQNRSVEDRFVHNFREMVVKNPKKAFDIIAESEGLSTGSRIDLIRNEILAFRKNRNLEQEKLTESVMNGLKPFLDQGLSEYKLQHGEDIFDLKSVNDNSEDAQQLIENIFNAIVNKKEGHFKFIFSHDGSVVDNAQSIADKISNLKKAVLGSLGFVVLGIILINGPKLLGIFIGIASIAVFGFFACVGFVRSQNLRKSVATFAYLSEKFLPGLFYELKNGTEAKEDEITKVLNAALGKLPPVPATGAVPPPYKKAG